MTAAAWSVEVNSWEFEVRSFCANVLSSFRANESGLEIADQVRNDGEALRAFKYVEA